MAVLDIRDRRSPAVQSIQTTSYRVGPGGGGAVIGNNLFAFTGIQDTNGNNVLLVVDATNPLAPVVEGIPMPQPFTGLGVSGTTMFATLGTAGFAAYSIPGVTLPAISCPANTDALLLMDRGANLPAQAFLDAKASLSGFIGSLRLPTDKVGVGSFTTSGTIQQQLTTDAVLAKAAFNGIIAGGSSYIGSGIAAAQTELKSTRATVGGTPMMVIVSDGVDAGAPTATATLSAAAAAKSVGIRIVAVQYGTGSDTLMKAIASSSADYFRVAP